MKKNFLYMAFLFLSCSISCEQEVKPHAPTYTQVFTGTDHKSWSIKSLLIRRLGKGDLSYGFDPCIMDDQYIFYANADRTYVITNGATKCSDSEPDILLTDTWSFVNATATLTIFIPALFRSAAPFIIKTANDKQLVLEIFLDQEGTTSYEIGFTPNKN